MEARCHFAAGGYVAGLRAGRLKGQAKTAHLEGLVAPETSVDLFAEDTEVQRG